MNGFEKFEMKRPCICLLIILWWIAALLPACAPVGTQEHPKQILRQRVQEFWQAKVQNNRKEAYEFLCPSVQDNLPLEAFHLVSGGMSFSAFHIEEISLLDSGRQARVSVNFSLKVMGMDFENIRREYPLIRENRQWCFKPESDPVFSKEDHEGSQH